MPAPSDPATLLVEILVHDLGLAAGNAIPDQRLKDRYLARGHRVDEIADALKQAVDREWVRWDEWSERMFLTPEGFAAGDT